MGDATSESVPLDQGKPQNSVLAQLRFAIRDDPNYKIEKPYYHTYWPKDIPHCNVKYESVDNIEIRDLRSHPLSFADHGIAVTEFRTSLSYEAFSDKNAVEICYLREARDCLRRVLGTTEVYITEYMVRRRCASFPLISENESKIATMQPVVVAHVDYTAWDTEDRIYRLFGEKAEQMVAQPYQMVNLWRPLRGPLRDWPLACCDPTSVDVDHDTITLDAVLPTSIGEVFNLHYNPKQRWYYLSDQQPFEAIIFKGYDSKQPKALGVPHCSFALCGSTPSEYPRESIEIRAFVFFNNA